MKNSNCRNHELCNIKNISVLFLVCHFLFTFTNKDMYLGIADYYIFLIGYVLCGGWLVLASRNSIDDISKYILYILIWMIIPIVIASFNGGISTGYFFSYILYLLVLFIALNANYSGKNIKDIINAYALAGTIIGLIIFLQRYDYYGGGGNRYTIKFFNNDAFDPNFLGAFLLFPALISVAKVLNKFTIYRTFSILLNCGGLFLTSSRAAMLSFLIGVTFVIIYSFKKTSKRRRIKILLFVGLLFVIALFVLPKDILSRLFESNYFDSSNKKRLLDWATGIEAFKIHPIFGYGFRSELSIIRYVTGKELIAHNTYIAFLLQFGIFGCGIFFICFAKLFKLIKKNLLLMGLLISNLFICIFISAEVAVFFWQPLIVIVLIAKYERLRGNKNEWL